MQLNNIHNEHEHASTNLKVLLLILAIVLIATLGYLVWLQNTAPVEDNDTTVIPRSQTDDEDETANWKTYVGDKYTMKYPADYTVKDEGTSGQTVTSNVSFLAPDESGDVVAFNIRIDPYEGTLLEYIASRGPTGAQITGTLGGVGSITITVDNPDDLTKTGKDIYALKDGHVYIITMNYSKDDDDKSLTYEKMVGTFAFVD